MTSSEAAETQFPLTCRNSYCSGAVCPFFRDITYLIFDSERILLQSHRAQCARPFEHLKVDLRPFEIGVARKKLPKSLLDLICPQKRPAAASE